MKNSIVILAALTLTAAAAFAQEPANRDRLDRIEQLPVRAKKQKEKAPGEFKKASVDVLPEIGYGSHFLSSPDFQAKPWHSGEYYFHALRLRLRPVRALSLNAVLGLSTERFQTRSSIFEVDADKNIVVRKMTETESADRKNNSTVAVGNVLLPVTLQVHIGDWSLRAGAEGLYTFSPRVKTDLRQGDVRTLTETKGVRIVPWSYDFLASVSWNGLGLYAKYQPASVRRFPEPGPSFSMWTFGLRIGID